MQDILDFLNRSSGAFQLVFSLVVALATVAYAILTERMWREMRYTNQRLDQPDVQVILEPLPETNLIFQLILRNWGNIPVYGVRLNAEPDNLPSFNLGPLKNLNLFTSTIPVLPERQEIRTLLLNYHDAKPLMNGNKIITFTVAYSTLHGKQCSQVYRYDLDVYMQLPFVHTKDIGDVINRLEKLTKELEHLSTSVKRIADSISAYPIGVANKPQANGPIFRRLMRWISELIS